MGTNNLSSSGDNFQFQTHIYTEDSKKTEYIIDDLDPMQANNFNSRSLLVPTAGLSDYGIPSDQYESYEDERDDSMGEGVTSRQISYQDDHFVKNTCVGTDDLELLMLEDQQLNDVISS